MTLDEKEANRIGFLRGNFLTQDGGLWLWRKGTLGTFGSSSSWELPIPIPMQVGTSSLTNDLFYMSFTELRREKRRLS